MILDKIENLHRYTQVLEVSLLSNALSEKIYDSVEEGKFEVGNNMDKFFGIIMSYNTKGASEGIWEAHRKYMDIHVILEGEELVYLEDIENCEVSQTYDADGDYGLFTANPTKPVVLKAGHFLALYPNEVHMTSVKNVHSSTVRKIVFKQRLA